SEIGGSAVLSGGLLWSFSSYKTLREEVPLGDPEIGKVVLSRFETLLEWIRNLDVFVGERVTNINFPNNTGYLFDVLQYIRKCEQIVSQSGHVIRDVVVESLDMAGTAVIGATM